MLSLQPSQLLIVGMASLGFLLIMGATRRHWRKSHERRDASGGERFKEQHSASAARDMEQVMVELDQLARQVHGKLDTRFAKLEAVIRDADDRIDRLSRLTRQACGQGTLDVTIDDQVEPTAHAKTNEPATRGSFPPLTSSSVPATLPSLVRSSSADPSSPAPIDEASPVPALTPRGQHHRDTIYKLADDGLDPLQIAQQVSRTAGEIELILSLRKAAALGR